MRPPICRCSQTFTNMHKPFHFACERGWSRYSQILQPPSLADSKTPIVLLDPKTRLTGHLAPIRLLGFDKAGLQIFTQMPLVLLGSASTGACQHTVQIGAAASKNEKPTSLSNTSLACFRRALINPSPSLLHRRPHERLFLSIGSWDKLLSATFPLFEHSTQAVLKAAVAQLRCDRSPNP